MQIPSWSIVVLVLAFALAFGLAWLLRRRERQAREAGDGEAGAGERSTWEERELDALLAEDSAIGGGPRRQHYDFAHLLLRGRFQADPGGLLRLLAGEDGPTLLRALWNEAGQGASDDAEPIDATGLSRTLEAWPGGGLLLVKLPRPRAITEAHFVALAVPEATDARYFTLEHGLDERGDARTVLCEWRDGAHYNFGDGPEADALAFGAAVRAKLDPPGTGN